MVVVVVVVVGVVVVVVVGVVVVVVVFVVVVVVQIVNNGRCAHFPFYLYGKLAEREVPVLLIPPPPRKIKSSARQLPKPRGLCPRRPKRGFAKIYAKKSLVFRQNPGSPLLGFKKSPIAFQPQAEDKYPTPERGDETGAKMQLKKPPLCRSGCCW